MGYRPITLPRELLNEVTWREVPPDEVAAARQAEEEAMTRAADQARAEACDGVADSASSTSSRPGVA
jgi:hypothetical protein